MNRPLEPDEEWGLAMILRQCDRCKEWLPYTEYRPESHLCRDCGRLDDFTPSIHAAGIYGKARGIRLTDKGRAELKRIHDADKRHAAYERRKSIASG